MFDNLHENVVVGVKQYSRLMRFAQANNGYLPWRR